MGRRRGQAAMEFLMTYGWALLVVLIAIGALAFFGVLNPSKFLPTSCVLGPGLACEDFKVVKGETQADDKIFINVRNGMGKTFDVLTVYVAKESSGSSEACDGFIGIAGTPNSGGDHLIFEDGALYPLLHLDPGGLQGINCDLGKADGWNCCSQLPYNIPVSYTDTICETTEAICSTGSSPLPPKGSKFSADLVIAYREIGTTILHKRVGQLTTQVE